MYTKKKYKNCCMFFMNCIIMIESNAIKNYNNGDKIKIFLNIENLENIYQLYFYNIKNLILKNIYVFSKTTILQYNNISIERLTYYC